MSGPGAVGERLLALFALGVVLFNPPLLSVFSVDATLLGFPALYIYLMASWAALIALVAVIVKRQGGVSKSRRDDGGQHTGGEDG